MDLVADILRKKSSYLYLIGQNSTVLDAVKGMFREQIGSLLVIDTDHVSGVVIEKVPVSRGKVCGIITERDYLEKVILKGRFSKKTQVREIMTSKLVYASESYTAEDCLVIMGEERLRRLPITSQETLVGLITAGDLVKHIADSLGEMPLGKVSEIIAVKGSQVHTIELSETVFHAVYMMSEHNVGSLVVTNCGKVCGIITERDYLRRIVVEGRSSRTTRIQEIMTMDLVTVEPQTMVAECIAFLSNVNFRRLPVLEGGKLAGILTVGDFMKHVSSRKGIRLNHV